MNTKEVWVVFNTESAKILHVYALEWQAENKATWYWTDPKAPVSGTKANTAKIEYMTLHDAIELIQKDYYNYAHPGY